MTETDFFRIARERMGDYTLVIVRNSAPNKEAYSVNLSYRSEHFIQRGNTLPSVLAELMRRAGVDRRATPRDTTPPAQDGSDRLWPNG